MIELMTESFRWVNLPFTVLLGIVVAYWLLVAIGLADSGFHGDAGSDLTGFNKEIDLEKEIGGGDNGGLTKDAGSGHHLGWFGHTLTFLNVGQVPLTFVVSVLALCLWMGSLLINRYLTDGAPLLSLALIPPNFVVSLIATKFITQPFRPLFRMLLRDGPDEAPVVGQRCRIVTSVATAEFGQAEVATSGAPLLLNVRTMNDAHMARGDQAIVVRHDAEHGVYFITPLPDSVTQAPNPS
jgi:hypothetical protein